MIRILTDLDFDILRKLVNGEAIALSSPLRLRLELAGAIRDGAAGIVVTPEGRRLAREGRAAQAGAAEADAKFARDRFGRRMRFQRKPIS